MMKRLQTNEFYEFGEFRLDLRTRRLLKRGGEIVSLTPKEFELLLLLVENAGQIVGKDELMEKLWEDTFVEEGTLTRNISWLRKKLAASGASEERFIETLPKRGYRFLAEVRKSEDTNDNDLIVEEQTIQRVRVEETLQLVSTEENPKEIQFAPPAALPERKSSTGQNNLLLWSGIAFGCIILTAIAFIIYLNFFLKTAPKTVLAAKVAPFSGLSGREDMPAFSPDGKQMAFAWNGDADNLDIYVKIIGAGEPVRLTSSPNDEGYPTFSPDGRQIAFVRAFSDHSEVILIPALGGAERRIYSLDAAWSSLSFSPDGQTLAVVDPDSTAGRRGIFLVNLQTGERRQLTAPDEFVRDNTPRFSPDGTSLAFLRSFDDLMKEIFIVPAAGGEPRQLTFDKTGIRSLAWSANGERVVFVSFRSSTQSNLWQIAASGGEPELISTGGKNITNIAVAPDGKSIAFTEESNDSNIWRIMPATPAQKFIASARADHSQQFSPDGSRIVFVSDRTGNNEIWISDADGKNQRQLTDSNGSAGSPRFSPDGKFIAFDAQTVKTFDIYVIPSDGGAARRLTDSKTRDTVPSWSADGEWIYFCSNRSGSIQLWRMRAVGGEAVQITRSGAFESFASPDGKTIFFSKGRGTAGLWKVPIEGGEESPIAELTEAGYWRYWTVTKEGIYFISYTSKSPYQIKFYEFASKKIKEAAIVQKAPLWVFPGLGVSPDGKTILYAQRDQSASSIILAEIGD
jgi:Tol biopolymer transport system component/DNA-binding winged helix-turn-helix (wHTH) protein